MSVKEVVRVPASSANLGPGFDSFAAALSLHLELQVEESEGFAVCTDLDVPRTRRNLCVRAFERLHTSEGLKFSIRSEIPLVGGLGSSAAAIVAGMLAAKRMYGLDEDVFAAACEMEGHADNVAAALRGGFVICADGEAVRFEPPSELETLAVIPKQRVSTSRARAALRAEVPLADATFNVAHAGLLILGLARGDWDLLARGLKDRLHERSRAPLFPRSYALLEKAARLGALGATISGAGPSVLVWCVYEQTGRVAAALRKEVEGWASVQRVRFETEGAARQSGSRTELPSAAASSSAVTERKLIL